MSYWRYWGLDAAPFANSAVGPLFRGATIEEALARIEFLVGNRRSVGLLVGKGGIGKSSILRYFASHPGTTDPAQTVRCYRASMVGIGKGELIEMLSRFLLGSRCGFSAAATQPGISWNYLCDVFQAARHEDMHTVLLLDDVECATSEGEMDVCRLLSMAFPLTVILSVESELLSNVNSVLLDRAELKIELQSWELSQTVEFLAWSMARVGHGNPIFTDEAVERIQEFSHGIPRRIVQLADLALVAGAVAAADCVDTDFVDQVAFELPRSWAA